MGHRGQRDDTANLCLITAGRPPSNATQLFELGRFEELLEEFRTEFDVTLFDAPPSPMPRLWC